MIIITPGAAEELRSIVVGGNQAVLKLDARLEVDNGYECSVNLVSEVPQEAEVEEIEGVKVAFCGEARAVFAGAILDLNDDGELTLDLAEEDCGSCCQNGDGCCDDGSCGPGCS